MNKVLEAINTRRICMRPKWHFVLKATLKALGAIILLLSLVYLASFILFALRQTGVLFVPLFGFRGWFAFLLALPWVLLFCMLLFVVILEILVRRYAFAYRKPMLYSGLGIVALVLITGTLVERTHLHQRLFMAAQHQGLPMMMGPMYRAFGDQRFRNINRGVVTTVITQGFTMQNRREEILTVVISPATRLEPSTVFAPQDMVVVFGDRDDQNVIQALGIRKIGE